MSKKKSFSGSTMTLKDFHGGSIPSDLPLPSAPGVSVRPTDRIGYDRSIGGSWGAAGMGGRMDHYRPSRPGSAGGAGSRGFVDEASPFLPPTVHIGRNFEEDERKPFDALSAPRRLPTAIDVDTVRAPRLDLKQSQTQQQIYGRPGSSPAAVPVPHHLSGGPSFPSGGVSPASQQVPGSGSGGPAPPNAWGVRKEVAIEPQVQSASTWSGPAAASRFAQASAIEKISSGRWQSKHTSFTQTTNAEIIRFSEVEGGNAGFQDPSVISGGVCSEARYHERIDASPLRYNERVDDSELRYSERVDVSERRYNERVNGHHGYERARSPVYPEMKERNNTLGLGSDVPHLESSEGRYGGPLVHQQEGRYDSSQVYQQDGRLGVQQVHWQDGRYGGPQVAQPGGRLSGPPGPQQEGRFNGSQVQQQVATEISERPKLMLLPRKKPLEFETMALDVKQGQLPSIDLGNAESFDESHGNQQSLKPGSVGSDGGNPTIDRPRLNLKPRTQHLEQPDKNIERERKSLFGGARPRELVLKERGSDIAPGNLNHAGPDNRAKHEISKMDVMPEIAASPNRHGERAESYPLEHRFGRVLSLERKDHRTEPEKMDLQRSSRKNDNWRNARESDKTVERRPEPESWRKPVEQPKSDIPGSRYGKTASALELAQAFSKSVSDTRPESRLTSQRGVPGRSQVPFSRLTDNREFYSGPGSRQINGY